MRWSDARVCVLWLEFQDNVGRGWNYLERTQEIGERVDKHDTTSDDLQQLQDLDKEITQSMIQAETQQKKRQ